MKTINKTIGLLGLALTIAACQKMDDYKKFTKDGEVVYPAKIDSLRIRSGNGRVQVSGALNADPRVVRYRVFWNSKLDSVDVPVTRTGGVDSVKYTINNLPEGPISFEVRTYDAQGNVSVPMNLVGNVYGPRYISSLNGRNMLGVTYVPYFVTNVKFQDISTASEVVAIQFKYTHMDNTIHDTVVVAKSKDQVIGLNLLKPTTSFQYRTVNMPDPYSIDRYYTPYITVNTSSEISGVVLKNYAQPMTASAYDNKRWGTLAEWTTNDAMRNHPVKDNNGNVIAPPVGGYASDDGGVMNIETGWGDAKSITNGKIYQTVTLPAGRYAFECELADNNDNGDPNAYLVATIGNEISNLENLSSAIGSTRVKNKRFEFVLGAKTTLSLGLAVTFGDYKYMKIRSLKLFTL